MVGIARFELALPDPKTGGLPLPQIPSYLLCGRDKIRTYGTLITFSGFQDRRNRPTLPLFRIMFLAERVGFEPTEHFCSLR